MKHSSWYYVALLFASVDMKCWCLSPCVANHIDCGRVQDPYTMRCVPQVHGVVSDTIQFVDGIITTEMNSALDNPVS